MRHYRSVNRETPDEAAVRALAEGVIRVDPDGSIWKLVHFERHPAGATYPIVPKRIDYTSTQGAQIFPVRRSKGDVTQAVVSRFLWTVAHGPIPEGMTVVYRDGNRSNTKLDNLELVTLAEGRRRSKRAPSV